MASPLVDIRDVLEWTETYAESARWAARMRHADSMLTALTNEEIDTGLDILRSQPTKVGRMELTLFVFERHPNPLTAPECFATTNARVLPVRDTDARPNGVLMDRELS